MASTFLMQFALLALCFVRSTISTYFDFRNLFFLFQINLLTSQINTFSTIFCMRTVICHLGGKVQLLWSWQNCILSQKFVKFKYSYFEVRGLLNNHSRASKNHTANWFFPAPSPSSEVTFWLCINCWLYAPTEARWNPSLKQISVNDACLLNPLDTLSDFWISQMQIMMEKMIFNKFGE